MHNSKCTWWQGTGAWQSNYTFPVQSIWTGSSRLRERMLSSRKLEDGLTSVKDPKTCRSWDCLQNNKQYNEIEVERFLVLVPETLRETVLDLHHSSLITTHPGIDETYRQIVHQCYWPKMKDEIYLFVKSCNVWEGEAACCLPEGPTETRYRTRV